MIEFMNVCTDNNKKGSKDKLLSREILRFPPHAMAILTIPNSRMTTSNPRSQGDDIIKAEITF